jgi:transcriptional regulator of acetoin/glycerol metabolism
MSLPTLAEIETAHIMRVLEATRGNVRKSAEILGIERTTLYRRLRRIPGLLKTVRHYVETPPTVQEVDV